MPIDNSTRFPKPLAADLRELSEGMAIVIDGDTAPKAIASGQYLFIKNHSTLATGGYHATAAIASGADITSSNVAADADGIVNGAFSSLSADISGKVGNLSSLATTAKNNLVAAVNEVKGNAKTNTGITLTAKVGTSTFESSVIRVGNVVTGHISIVTTGNTGDSVTMISGFPTPQLNPQLPVWAVSGTQAGKRVLIDASGNMMPWWCSGIPAGNYIIPISYIATP